MPGVEVRGKLGGTRRERAGPRPRDPPPVQGLKARGERRFGHQATTALRGGDKGKKGKKDGRSMLGSRKRIDSGGVRREGADEDGKGKAKRFER